MTNEPEVKEIRNLLKQFIPPVRNTELSRDLWPSLLRKFEHHPARVPWFDWALAAILGAVLLLYPASIPALLYHL